MTADRRTENALNRPPTAGQDTITIVNRNHQREEYRLARCLSR
jgi:hypothetical protein